MILSKIDFKTVAKLNPSKGAILGIVPKRQPKFRQFREWLAFRVVALARKIKPKNDAVKCFWLEEVIQDAFVNGEGFYRIEHNKFFGDNPKINM